MNSIGYLSLIVVCILLGLILASYVYEYFFAPLGLPFQKKMLVQKKKWLSSSTELLNKAAPILIVLAIQISINLAIYSIITVVNGDGKSFFDSFEGLWRHWDTESFLIIAEHGYPTEGSDRYRLVFYPLYPALMKAFNYLVDDYFLSGVLVSLISYSLAAQYFYKLVLLEFKDARLAYNAVLFMAVYPFSFFFGVVYTEGLFLFLSVACFYHIRREQWVIAGIFGLFASLTRNQGVILMIPFVIEALYRYPIFDKAAKTWHWDKKLSYTLACSLLIFCGILLYLVVNKHVSGSYFTFLEYQKDNWSQRFGFFANNLSDIAVRATQAVPRQIVGIWVPALVLFFVHVGLYIYAVGKLRLSYLAYGLVMLLISYSPTWLLSGPRYTAVIFVVFIAAALLFNNRPRAASIAQTISCMFLVVYAFLFNRGAVF